MSRGARKKYKVELSAFAQEQLQQAMDYWRYRNGSTAYAHKLYNLVRSAIGRIERTPYICAERWLRGEIYRSYKLTPSYSLIYQVDEAQRYVVVVMLWHNAQDSQ